MFRFFDGVPRLIVPDNLKSGVSRASFYDPEINRSYGIMASHYGAGVLPARPRRPKDKAKVENGVRFAQTCILGRLRKRRSSHWLDHSVSSVAARFRLRPKHRKIHLRRPIMRRLCVDRGDNAAPGTG